ncbi:hypothetical protein EFR01_16990 [Sinorhizobium fredii]|nr:hypothetical protein EFR01_16990 [Sinorhizobium fredii]GLS07117.1 hypothetical protein GCM10007864_07430 [Sinorhizobium fredii]
MGAHTAMHDARIMAQSKRLRDPDDIAPENSSARAREKAALSCSPSMRRSGNRATGISHNDRDFLRILDDLEHFDQNFTSPS